MWLNFSLRTYLLVLLPLVFRIVHCLLYSCIEVPMSLSYLRKHQSNRSSSGFKHWYCMKKYNWNLSCFYGMKRCWKLHRTQRSKTWGFPSCSLLAMQELYRECHSSFTLHQHGRCTLSRPAVLKASKHKKNARYYTNKVEETCNAGQLQEKNQCRSVCRDVSLRAVATEQAQTSNVYNGQELRAGVLHSLDNETSQDGRENGAVSLKDEDDIAHESLQLLEWPILCQQVAAFAKTPSTARHITSRNLRLGTTQVLHQALLNTLACWWYTVHSWCTVESELLMA